jgi:omega-amidase
MKIGLVQLSPCWEDIQGSIKIADKIVSETNEKIDLLIFPELSLSGFTMNSGKFAEEFDGPATQYFKSLAEKLKVNIICGVIERDKKNYYNSLIHYDEIGLLKARYRKIHSFTLARENEFYESSDELVITEINHFKIGLSICYDLRFPELYRFYAKRGVEILIDIANWPIPRIEHWSTLLKARAIENQCFMIGVNRVGSDIQNLYCGISSVYNPLGKEILKCDDSQKIFICEIDLNEVQETRKKLPFLADIKLL